MVIPSQGRFRTYPYWVVDLDGIRFLVSIIRRLCLFLNRFVVRINQLTQCRSSPCRCRGVVQEIRLCHHQLRG